MVRPAARTGTASRLEVPVSARLAATRGHRVAISSAEGHHDALAVHRGLPDGCLVRLGDGDTGVGLRDGDREVARRLGQQVRSVRGEQGHDPVIGHQAQGPAWSARRRSARTSPLWLGQP